MDVTRWDRRPIAAPGIYAGIPLEQYHSADICDGPSVSSSGLRTLLKESPAHFWAYSPLNDERVEEPESKAFTLGRAAHHLLLGEDDFSTLFIVRPDEAPDGRAWNGNNKSCREWIERQERDGRTVLKREQIETIRGMARALAAHPLVAAGILNGEIERSLIWRDEDTGIWLKSRPDAIPNWSGDYADLKTCISVRTEALERTIAEYGYHQQAALVAEGVELLTGSPLTSFSLVFVEKTPPYCVRVVTLKDADIERGRKQNHAALRILARCIERGEWPGPGGADAEYLGLPPWEATRIDNDLMLMEQELA